MEKWRRTTAVPFWSDLSTELQQKMLDTMTIKRFSATKQIDLKRLTGAGADALWVILEGNVSIFIESIEGKNCRLLRMHEGQGNHTLMALRGLRFYVKASVEKCATICVIIDRRNRASFGRVPHPIPPKRCIAEQGALSIFRWTSKNGRV